MNVFDALFPGGSSLDRDFLRTDVGRRLSYGQALAQSAQLAHTLESLGVTAGDRVAVQVEKSPEAILLYLATLRLGAVYLPLNTAYTAAELEYFLGDAQPSLFVCAPERQAQLEPLARGLRVTAVATLDAGGEGSLPEQAQVQASSFATVARAADELAAILYTSGTTGRSKGAMLTHGNLIANARTLAAAWCFVPEDVLLHALPIFHIHGLFVAINVTLAAGSSLLLLPKFDPEQVLSRLPQATLMMGVPTFYVRLLQNPRLDRQTTARSRVFISGSAPLLAETHHEWLARTGHRLLERYGMSETGMNTSNPYDGERVPGSVGPALPDVELRIVDPASARPLPTGEIGLIEVRGPNVFAGYWRQPEKTRAEFRPDGFFMTGDLGRLDERGYVYIVGRARDLVISGGYNVYPREVESEIDRLPGVIESAVFGVPHPDYGEGVTAAVVCAPGAPPASETQMLQALRARLAAYKLPKRLFFVDGLPRNSMGKVEKKKLRELYADTYRRSVT
jgi:malonyl-CoA/methylmalonyl-CoA synthetase